MIVAPLVASVSVQARLKAAPVFTQEAGLVEMVTIEGAQAVVWEVNALEVTDAPAMPAALIGVRTQVVVPVLVGTPGLEIVTPPAAAVAGAETEIGTPLQTRVTELAVGATQVTVAVVVPLSIQEELTTRLLALAAFATVQIFFADPPKQP